MMPLVGGDELGSHLRGLHPWVRLVSISAVQGKERPPWADQHIMKRGELFADLERTVRGGAAQA